MKFSNLLIALSIFVFFISCTKEEPKEEEFKFEYSFTIDGIDYSFSDFKVDTSYIAGGNRLFISKADGDNRFNMNFPLDLTPGIHGMDWNSGPLWFYVRIPKGDFYTLDNTTCTMNLLSIDKEKRTISATFQGVGSHGVNPATIEIKNGVLKAKY